MLDTVTLDRIRTDGGTQPREYLNELILSEYTEAMAMEADFPPVVVFYDGSHYWLADGFHRYFAAKKHGMTSLAAEVQEGTRRDAVLYATGANMTHGLRRTNADKRRAVLTLLQDEEWQRWSNREIARQCGVTHSFVGKVRQELVAKHEATAPQTAPTSGGAAMSPATSQDTPSRLPPAPTLSDPMAWTSLHEEEVEDSAAPSWQHQDAFPAPSATEPLPSAERVTAAQPAYAESPADGAGHPVAQPQPAATAPDLGREPQHHGHKVSIVDIASSSHQTPDEWVAEMMVYWLLDLADQYDGITHAIVQQAAARLVPQYERVCQDVAVHEGDV